MNIFLFFFFLIKPTLFGSISDKTCPSVCVFFFLLIQYSHNILSRWEDIWMLFTTEVYIRAQSWFSTQSLPLPLTLYLAFSWSNLQWFISAVSSMHITLLVCPCQSWVEPKVRELCRSINASPASSPVAVQIKPIAFQAQDHECFAVRLWDPFSTR